MRIAARAIKREPFRPLFISDNDNCFSRQFIWNIASCLDRCHNPPLGSRDPLPPRQRFQACHACTKMGAQLRVRKWRSAATPQLSRTRYFLSSAVDAFAEPAAEDVAAVIGPRQFHVSRYLSFIGAEVSRSDTGETTRFPHATLPKNRYTSSMSRMSTTTTSRKKPRDWLNCSIMSW